jgi:curved DNA-binding protein CbpA
LALKFHPDKSLTDNKEEYQKIAKAYKILKDPEQRRIYDNDGYEAVLIYQTLIEDLKDL